MNLIRVNVTPARPFSLAVDRRTAAAAPARLEAGGPPGPAQPPPGRALPPPRGTEGRPRPPRGGRGGAPRPDAQGGGPPIRCNPLASWNSAGGPRSGPAPLDPAHSPALLACASNVWRK